MRFNGFAPDGPFAVLPETIDEYRSLTLPEPARFFSAHFAFTTGEFCREIPYDPQLYFFGEEPSMALRAYSHGYDLFHPHRVVLWHHYGREKSPRHWVDHRRWYFRNELSMRRFRRLVEEGRRGVAGEESSLRPYGLGSSRRLQDYERYTGISFELRGATRHAMKASPPPEPDPPATQEDWRMLILRPNEVLVPLTQAEVAGSADLYDFAFVGAHSAQGEELVRYDLRAAELEQALWLPPLEFPGRGAAGQLDRMTLSAPRWLGTEIHSPHRRLTRTLLKNKPG